MNPAAPNSLDPKALLAWYIAMGADEAIAVTPVNRFINPGQPAETVKSAGTAAQRSIKGATDKINQKPTPIIARPAQPVAGAGAEAAHQAAAACTTLADLQAALSGFDGGVLKKSAKHTVFADGNANSPLMIIGDTPGNEEDQAGIPFVGPYGKLLDKMLAAIGTGREDGAYLADFIPWRPLGNSTPDSGIIAMLKPFMEKHIELAAPKVVMLMGALPMQAFFDTSDSMSRQRGKWKTLTVGGHSFAAIATYHPKYLLTQPHQKAAAWQDLLAVKEKLLSS